MCSLQTYLIYTDSEIYTMKNKVADKDFRKSPDAINSICSWISDVALGLKKFHSNGYVHLNIHSATIMITAANTAKIGGFNFTRHISTQIGRVIQFSLTYLISSVLLEINISKEIRGVSIKKRNMS